MIFNKWICIKNIILFSCVFLTGCSLSAKPNLSVQKLFELDLTNSGISAEGGEIELNKKDDYCFIVLSLYGETGQEMYNLKFKKNILISGDYLKYRYKNGMIVVDDDLKELIANYQPNSGNNDMELVVNKSFIGSENKNAVKIFNEYKQKIPQGILRKNCY